MLDSHRYHMPKHESAERCRFDDLVASSSLRRLTEFRGV